jgi:hypothetical protein
MSENYSFQSLRSKGFSRESFNARERALFEEVLREAKNNSSILSIHEEAEDRTLNISDLKAK